MGGERVIACPEALICWLEVLEEKSRTLSSQMDVPLSNSNSFPLEMHLGQRSCSAAICKSLVSLFAARQRTGLGCLYSEQWNISFPVWAHSELLGSILMDVIAPTFLLLLSSRALHSRNHANAGLVCGWRELFFPAFLSFPLRFSARKLKNLLEVLGGDRVMFLYPR